MTNLQPRILVAAAGLVVFMFAGANAQPVIFSVDTDLDYDTVYAGQPVSIIFSVNANGARVSSLGFPLGFTFSNGNIIGPIEEVPSSTTAEFRFSDTALQVFESRTFDQFMGADFFDAPLDTFRVQLIDFGGSKWTGSGEVFRLVFSPLDTGSFTIFEYLDFLPGPKHFQALAVTGISLPVVWEDFDLSIPRRPDTVRVRVQTSYGHDSLYLGARGSIIFTVDWAGHDISATLFHMEFHFSNGNVIGPIEEVPSATSAEFEFSDYAQQVFENRPFNSLMGADFHDSPDTLFWGCLDFGSGGWTESRELCRITFSPLDTGTIMVDERFIDPLAILDQDALPLSYDWQPAIFTVAPCPVTMGDVNLDGPINSADAIYLVGHVFKGGPPPEPRRETGDVDCSGSVTSADIIYLVNYIFKGDEAPCGCYAGTL